METIRFDELNLDPRILRAVTDMGFEAASPIQAQAIPVEMEGHDMIGQAQTGTGKTAAFGIPLLMKMDPENRKTQAMILCPTRELAIQVAEELRRLAKYMSGIKILPVYGGQEIVKQIRSLKGGVQIIVGTPGRVTFHAKSNVILNLALVPLSTKESDKSRCFASARESSEFLNDSNLLINFSSILFYILQQQLILTSIKINQINCVQCWNLF